MTANPDIFEHFDWRWFREYLKTIRESGIINMYASSPLLYMGKDSIDRYYGEGKEDEEEFEKVLDGAEESKNKIIKGIMSYMRSKGKDLDDMDEFNRLARNFSQKILSMYITMASVTGNL
jgi:transcription termination factor NusB